MGAASSTTEDTMPEAVKTSAPSKPNSLPNYNDPETKRLLDHWDNELVVGPDGRYIKKFTTCPVCRFAMRTYPDQFNGRMVCSWDPAHTPE